MDLLLQLMCVVLFLSLIPLLVVMLSQGVTLLLLADLLIVDLLVAVLLLVVML